MDSATITCPYCGNKNEISDLWEYDEGRHETDCENCGKQFTFSLEIDVAYALTDAERIEEK